MMTLSTISVEGQGLTFCHSLELCSAVHKSKFLQADLIVVDGVLYGRFSCASHLDAVLISALLGNVFSLINLIRCNLQYHTLDTLFYLSYCRTTI